jgi:hypothetical protein
MSKKDNSNSSSRDESLEQSIAVDTHTSGGIESPQKAIEEMLNGKHGRKWRALWLGNLSGARKHDGSPDKYQDREAAVNAFVYKVGKLTNHDMVILKEVLRRSEYEASIDFDASQLDSWREDAIDDIGMIEAEE